MLHNSIYRRSHLFPKLNSLALCLIYIKKNPNISLKEPAKLGGSLKAPSIYLKAHSIYVYLYIYIYRTIMAFLMGPQRMITLVETFIFRGK